MRLYLCLGEYKEWQEKTWTPVCLFPSYALFVWLCASVCPSIRVRVCVFGCGRINCIFAQIRLAQPTGFGHRAWLPFCKQNQAKIYALNLLIYTNTHKAPGNNAVWSLPMPPPHPKYCWHTQCLYSHGAFFHRLSYQFNQAMKNKRYFCAAVFVFDKWFIWWKVWSRPCPQYLFQAAADSSRSWAEYL